MDRRHKHPDKVNVYRTSEDKLFFKPPLSTRWLVPYSLFGLDYYLVDDVMYPGYFDGEGACVYLDRPVAQRIST